jgi:hypothetical protein
MRHRRHTITVASSTLFFVCLVLHAQTGLHAQASTPYNDAHARKVYESLLPAVAFNTAAFNSAAFHPAAFHIATAIAVVGTDHTQDLLSGENISYVLENKDGIWNSMRWRSTSRAWAS